jgi:solute carrier family 10 (sodium/bile acid cotransporter), member 7
MQRFLAKQWFLVALAGVLLAGFLLPGPFRPLASAAWLRSGIVATVLFLMALPMESRVVLQTIRAPWAALLGSAINMGAMPLLAWGASHLLSGELAVGLIVASVAPCTLASAAVWTRRAGGNDTTAILVTLLTNATCFLTTPLWLKLLTRTETQMELVPMILRLGLLVVLPMTLAQLLRLSPFVAELATRRRAVGSSLAQIGILAMVLIGAVNASEHLPGAAGADGGASAIRSTQLALMILVTLGLHATGLVLGYAVARMLGFGRPNRIAVAVAGSQKTLMVGLFVALNYFGGVAILPMISYHVGQLFLDTFAADWWAREQEEGLVPK